MNNPEIRHWAERVFFVSACNNPDIYERYAARCKGIEAGDFHRLDNVADNRPVPVRYNQFIDALANDQAGWIVFAHNDFLFHEDPRPMLGRVSKDAIYGVVGADLVRDPNAAAGSGESPLRIVTRGQVACSTELVASGLCGDPVTQVEPATTVDCCCIILHTSLVRRHSLRFDESYDWHFYSEELSLRAFRQWGICTFVLPVRSGHYGLGSTHGDFQKFAEQLSAQYGERFVSTCSSAITASRKEAAAATTGPAASEGTDKKPVGAVMAGVAVSVVIVVHRMSRQAMRSLQSLSPAYQLGVTAEQYEVLVFENASDDTLSPEFVRALPSNFRYTLLDPGEPSPVFALNRGLREARGKLVGAMIDGARIVTPELIRRALFASRLHPLSVITTLGWYLGCDVQGAGLLHGHSSEREDELLADIEWPKNPYRLFEVSTPDQSSVDGWVAPIAESNAIFMSRDLWSRLGGYEERFTSPGGGLANLDLLKRACEAPKAQHVLLCDEATFHQSHGGVATNATPLALADKLKRWGEEYLEIRGEKHRVPDQRRRVLYGTLRPQMAAHFASALISPVRTPLRLDGRGAGYLAEREAWPVRRLPLKPVGMTAPGQGPEPALDRIVQLTQQLFSQGRFAETREVCRMALASLGHGRHRALERMLTQCANVPEDLADAAPRRRSQHLVAMAQVHQLLDQNSESKAALEQALELDGTNDQARFDLASLLLPGPGYFDRLSDVHEILAPGIYLEIGVFQGDSMALARPPTLAFGVDPKPALSKHCRVETRIHPVTSDVFFQRNNKLKLIPRRVDFAFIDGLHDFMQVVRDFWNTERLCHTHSIVAFHDTLPLDEASATKAHNTGFWTGDVWKIIPFLMRERPELRVVTVRAPPSGLTLVSGLRPWHPVSLEQTLARAAEFDRLEFREFARDWRPRMKLIDNARAAVGNWLLFREPEDGGGDTLSTSEAPDRELDVTG